MPVIPSSKSGGSRPPDPEQSDAGFYINLRLLTLSQIGFLFAHRFSFQIDSICIVNKPIQDGIGQSRITDNLMPVLNGQLTGHQGWAQSVTIFEDFQ